MTDSVSVWTGCAPSWADEGPESVHDVVEALWEPGKLSTLANELCKPWSSAGYSPRSVHSVPAPHIVLL